MPSEATNDHTRREWRELGFFYDADTQTKEWRIVGSRAGINRFGEILLQYAADPRNEKQSEHNHYGPYMYLKIMTWPIAGFSSDSIHGPTSEMRRLGNLVKTHVVRAAPGIQIRISQEYSREAEYSLVLDVRGDDFDPALEDPSLAPGAG
jgi:hypothetical protein